MLPFNMKKLLAIVVFSLGLFVGLPSFAMAHENAPHDVQPSVSSSMQTVQQARTEGKTFGVIASAGKQAQEKANPSKCPCGKDCAKCMCSMATCCQFMGKTANNLHLRILDKERSQNLAEFLVYGLSPETLAEPPRIS